MENSVKLEFPLQFQYYCRAIPRWTKVEIIVLFVIVFVLIPIYLVQHAELEGLEQQLLQFKRTHLSIKHPQAIQTPENWISDFYTHIPKESGVSQVIDRFLGIVGNHKVDYSEIDYRLLPVANTHLLTLEILMPLKGSYQDIRQMMVALLNDMPSIAMTEAHFERENAQTSQVNARLSFRVYLLHE